MRDATGIAIIYPYTSHLHYLADIGIYSSRKLFRTVSWDDPDSTSTSYRRPYRKHTIDAVCDV